VESNWDDSEIVDLLARERSARLKIKRLGLTSMTDLAKHNRRTRVETNIYIRYDLRYEVAYRECGVQKYRVPGFPSTFPTLSDARKAVAHINRSSQWSVLVERARVAGEAQDMAGSNLAMSKNFSTISIPAKIISMPYPPIPIRPKRVPAPPQIVYTDEYGCELTPDQIQARLVAIHDEEYADWGGWSDPIEDDVFFHSDGEER